MIRYQAARKLLRILGAANRLCTVEFAGESLGYLDFYTLQEESIKEGSISPAQEPVVDYSEYYVWRIKNHYNQRDQYQRVHR